MNIATKTTILVLCFGGLSMLYMQGNGGRVMARETAAEQISSSSDTTSLSQESGNQPSDAELSEMTLTELMQIEVDTSSVSENLFTNSDDPMAEMSLEELMQIVIDSSSMTIVEEALHGQPSSYTIDKQQISDAGAKTISEVLGLCPDVKVDNADNDVFFIIYEPTPQLTSDEAPIKYQPLRLMINSEPLHDNKYTQTSGIDISSIERVDFHKLSRADNLNNTQNIAIANIITKH